MKRKKKFYQEDEFKELQSKWYKKLEKSGFDDLEWYNPDSGFGQNSRFLKFSTPSLPNPDEISGSGGLASSNTYKYYQNCRDFLENYDKFTRMTRLLWTMHTDGQSYRSISKYLRSRATKQPYITHRHKQTSKSFSVFWVHTEIMKLHKIMKDYIVYED
jgi:hypothetical protein